VRLVRTIACRPKGKPRGWLSAEGLALSVEWRFPVGTHNQFRGAQGFSEGTGVTKLRTAALAGLTLAALVLPAQASAIRLPKSWPFYGHTSQGLPVQVNENRSVTAIVRFAIEWKATCTDGSSTPTLAVNKATRLPILWAGQTAHFAGHSQGTTAGTYQGQPGTVTFTLQVHGRLRKYSPWLRGTFTWQQTFVDANGNQIATCSTGLVHWKAQLA
jgi:hypothetical protein